MLAFAWQEFPVKIFSSYIPSFYRKYYFYRNVLLIGQRRKVADLSFPLSSSSSSRLRRRHVTMFGAVVLSIAFVSSSNDV